MKTVHIDWLVVSTRGGYGPAAIFGADLGIGIAHHQPSEMRPLPRYNKPYALSPAGRYDTAEDPQGGLITFTGSDCEVLRLLGVDERATCGRVSSTKGANVTRIDIAVNVIEEGAKATDLLEAFKEGRVTTRAKRYSHIETVDRSGSRGVTVSVGGRASERYLRVYDKGLQLGLEGDEADWVRVEIECKGRYALSAAKAVARSGADGAARAIISNFVSLVGVGWWESMFDGVDEAEVEKPGRRVATKYDKWLHDVALVKVVDAIEGGDADCISAVLSTLRKVGLVD